MVKEKVIQVFGKIFIATLGATNAMFSIFIPIGLALLLTPFVTGFSETALMIIALLSSMYRAIDIGFLTE